MTIAASFSVPDAARAVSAFSGFAEALGLTNLDIAIGGHAAAEALNRGDPGKGLALYSALLLLQPGNADNFIGVAECALALGGAELALQASEGAALTAPTDARARFVSARAKLLLRRRPEALADLRAAHACAEQAGDRRLKQQIGVLLTKVEALSGADGVRAGS